MTPEKLITRILSYSPRADVTLVRRAATFAAAAHAGQFRVSGETYVQHPLEVAKILTELEIDVITIAAALLHDVVEDTTVDLEVIEQEFGKEVAGLVDGVTKLNRIEFLSREEEQVENLRKMFLAMARDIRVILIKLADRLHNMRTLTVLPVEKQKEISRETLDVFAPLAHRLGINRIKWELEDLAFHYLEPERYYELVEKVAKKRRDREEYIELSISTIRDHLNKAGIEADIQGRPKHFHSIYRKMVEQQKEFGEIYDLTAIRIVVETVKDCYGALGIIHSLWKPVPGRFKDYIAMPKTNMYQSLHTTVIGLQGEPLEIQIRTEEMHRTSEYGIAAHWRYKEGGKGDKDFEQKLAWLRQLLEWQYDMRDAKEFMETLKVDLFADEVFVFTPRGDVIDLPAGAVPVDFAYRIHTDIGNRCVGAKINGKIVPLDYKLKNGDIVEILTTKQSNGPSRDWLKIVKTSQAKGRIRQWFKREQREENIAKGRDILEREGKRLSAESQELLKAERLETFAEKAGYANAEELYLALGEGRISGTQTANRLYVDYCREKGQPLQDDLADLKYYKPESKVRRETGQDIKVGGIDNVLYRFSKCCNPLPGDAIVGYITRGRGVSIHRTDCPNVLGRLENDERVINVSWEDVPSGHYLVDVDIEGVDRSGLLSDVINTIAETRTNITSVNAHTDKRRIAHIDLTLEIKNLAHLEYLLEKVRKTRDVFNAVRVTRNTERVSI